MLRLENFTMTQSDTPYLCIWSATTTVVAALSCHCLELSANLAPNLHSLTHSLIKHPSYKISSKTFSTLIIPTAGSRYLVRLFTSGEFYNDPRVLKIKKIYYTRRWGL